MQWNFPKPEEDWLYRKHYDQKYGKGSFDRDFLSKKDTEETHSESKTPSDFYEVSSPFKHYWNSEHNVGILERNGKFIGVCVLAAKEITDGESYIRKFGLDFRKDIQWNAAASLIDHLSRSPLFKAILITTKKTPFKLEPDTREELEGRNNWLDRNYQYHKDVLDTVNNDVKASREAGMFPVADDLLNRQKEEALNAARFLDQQSTVESQIASHLKPYHLIKDNVFAAALFFYIYTSIHDTFEKAVQEIISRKESAKKEAALTYFVKCSDVTDHVIVFSPSFPPYWDEARKYYNLVLAKDVAGFEADKGVAVVLKKMFTTALEVPPESVSVDEKIHIPTDLQMPASKPAFLGYVVSSVVKREATRAKVFFPLDVLVKHGIITGSSGKGKTFFAAHLALEACRQNVKVIIIDPHGTFRFMPKHENMEIHFVSSAQEVIDLLDRVYSSSMQQPIQKEDRLKTLVIVDEISSGKFGPDIKRISKRLDNCYTELRKFGTGMVVICQHLSESRGISTAVRENAETLFLFRKKELNELERVRTLRHPSLSLLPYLPVGFMAIVSEDFHSEPFFVRIPRVRTLSSNMEAHDDEIPAATITTTMSTAEEEKEQLPLGNHSNGMPAVGSSSVEAVCKACGYKWQPRKSLEQVKECPACKTRDWK